MFYDIFLFFFLQMQTKMTTWPKHMSTNQPQILTNSFLKILKVSVAPFSHFPIFPGFPGFSRIFYWYPNFSRRSTTLAWSWTWAWTWTRAWATWKPTSPRTTPTARWATRISWARRNWRFLRNVFALCRIFQIFRKCDFFLKIPHCANTFLLTASRMDSQIVSRKFSRRS